MRIIVTGATGFIGSALCKKLYEDGYDVIALTRNPDKGKNILGNYAGVEKWDCTSADELKYFIEGAYGIVNLAGENIGAGVWTNKKKNLILESRLNAGEAVALAIKQAQNKPKVVIQASAIGYYGPHDDEILDESSSNGTGFLAGVAKQWENSSKEAESSYTRHIIIRTGVVLGNGGGALPSIMKSFHLFVGGHIGSGKQWFSWIHIDDESRAISFLLKKEELKGIFNLTAPEPLMMKDFCTLLGKIMHRPSRLNVPGFAMKLLLGEMAEEMLLTGQKVIPRKLQEAGFEFLYPNAEKALRVCV